MGVPRRYRRWVVAGLAATLAAVSVGAQGAAAAPVSQPGAASVAAIASSTRLAATYLQHAPNSLRQLAADGILFESIFLLAPHHSGGLHFAARHAALAHSAAIPIPGTVVGGLVLNSYCQSLGFDHSMLIGNIVIGPGAAYSWVCVAASGAQTPIDMQAACLYQYPGQVTIAYPQDVNNGFSWVCIAPTTSSFTDPTTGTTVTTLITANGAVTLITSPTGASVTFSYNGSVGTVVQDPNGGYIADSGGGSTLPILVFEGGGSTLPILATDGAGGTLPI